MEAVKHTPGPWEARSLYIRTLNGQVVARCHGTLGKFELEEPNARLIAAAPELLDVLRCIRERLELSMGDHICAEDVFDSFYREIMDEAIAKAMGAKP